MGSIDQNSTFSEYGHFANQIKENHECSKIVANILLVDSPDPGDGVSRSKFNFSEHGPVAYQIKKKHECSNIVANILPTDSLDPGDGVNR